MKYLLLLSLILLPGYTHSMEKKPDPVESRVYTWPQAFEDHAPGVKKARVLGGSTSALDMLEVLAYQLSPGVTHMGAALPNVGSLIIIKSGIVHVNYQEDEVRLGPGSVQVLFPGDGMRIENKQAEQAEYYVFYYAARKDIDRARGEESGGSFYIDWEELEVRETKRGESRSYFDKPTASFSRFEMHVTTLKEGLRSHDVHTHREEEFLLIIKGQVEEHIDGTEYPATVGDLIFVDSMVPHTITNVGNGAARYFAFKWE